MSVERSAPRGAVFLSYASQDAEAARKIADALRGAGIEVWFDRSELRGGDAWDAKIRKQIAECALFIPVISASTQARLEGYFRIEWKLAAQRTHAMAEAKPFLLPVVIDATRDAEAHVPGEFRAVQWTRLRLRQDSAAVPSRADRQGEASDEQQVAVFGERVKKLLSGDVDGRTPSPAGNAVEAPTSAQRTTKRRLSAIAGAFSVVISVFAIWQPWRNPVASAGANPKSNTQNPSVLPSAGEGVNARPANMAPAKSVAVLPFANLSPDAENAFFADGMHEELLTALAKIRDLKVISRTSVLAYRDPAKRNLRQIAAELGVAHVLEGSVRRAGNEVRITVQLIDAATDAHRWADHYTGTLTDVFKLQADISSRIAQTLAATLSPAEKAALATKLTSNPAAYDLYLKAKANFGMGLLGRGRARYEEALLHPLEQAVELDPSFAAAWAALGHVHVQMHNRFESTPERLAKAKDAIDRASRIAPHLAEVHVGRGAYFGFGVGDWPRAVEQYANALAAAPGNSDAIAQLGLIQYRLGRWAEGLANFERAASLDPQRLNRSGDVWGMTQGLVAQRLYRKAEAFRAQPRPVDSEGDVSGATATRAMLRFLIDRDRSRFAAAIEELKRTEAAEETNWKYRSAMLAGRFAEAASLHETNDSSLTSGRARVDTSSYCEAAWLAGNQAGARARAAGSLARQRVAAPEEPRAWRNLIWRAMLHAYVDEKERARALAAQALEEMPIARDAMDGPNALLGACDVYLVLGEKERALELLERALSVPSPVLLYDHPDLAPLWAPLWNEPRYKAALEKMKSLD